MILRICILLFSLVQILNPCFDSNPEQGIQCPFDKILWVDDTSGFIRKYGELMIKYPLVQSSTNSIHDSVLRNANLAIRDFLNNNINRIDNYLNDQVQYLIANGDESLRDTFSIQVHGELEYCNANIFCIGFSFAEQHWINGMSFVQCETALNIDTKSGKRVELSEILAFTDAQYNELLDSINAICMVRNTTQVQTSEEDSTGIFVTAFYRYSSGPQRSYTLLNEKFVLSKQGIFFKTSPDGPLSITMPVFLSYKNLATIGLVNLNALRKYIK